jgi:hypothetical protein
LSCSRNESSTAFLIHWWVTQSPSIFLGDAQAAFVEPAEDFGNGFADALRGLPGCSELRFLPRLLDDLLDCLHGCFPRVLK